MERVLIVNADDFGLSKGQNYGIIEACRNGVVTSTTALVNGAAIDHAAQLSRSTPELAVGMHFVLTLGEGIMGPVTVDLANIPCPFRRLHRKRKERPLKAVAHAVTSQGSGGLYLRLQGRRGLPKYLV